MVDILLAQPLAERGQEEVTQAIFAMFKAYDATQPVISTAVTELLAGDAELIGLALIAQMITELRDYAGRLGSYVVIAITGRPAVVQGEQDRLRTDARPDPGVRDTISRRLADHPAAAVREAHDAAQKAYFTDGMRVIDEAHRRQSIPGSTDTPEASPAQLGAEFRADREAAGQLSMPPLIQLEAVHAKARAALVFLLSASRL